MKVSFSAEIEVPDDASLGEVEEFLKFHLHVTGVLSGTNRFINDDICTMNCKNLCVKFV